LVTPKAHSCYYESILWKSNFDMFTTSSLYFPNLLQAYLFVSWIYFYSSL